MEKIFVDFDFSRLMDLRVDYSFKRFFALEDVRFLISLLNAVFANKRIARKIVWLDIENPFFERNTHDDKLSVLDIAARLDDGTRVLIEMHLYDVEDLKYKVIRSWARGYGEGIKKGEDYSTQPPVICVSFINAPEDMKIHTCCKIMDIEDKTVFIDSLELHYINMNAFAKAINENGGIGKGETEEIMLANWLAVIAEKDIKDKAIIKNICKEKEEIRMAVSTLARLSEDVIIRHAYEKRQDEITLFKREQEKYKRRAEVAEKALEEKDAENEQLRLQLAELRSRLGEK